MNRPGEEGIALLTVLLLVAVLSTLAVGMLDDIRFGLRRQSNAETTAQARWYAIGAESLAAVQLARLTGTDALKRGEWNGRVFRFPIEGGAIQARLRDGTTCFNLNSVVEGAGEVLRRRERGAAQLQALLIALDVAPRQAEMLTAALIDWIDSDQMREAGGAEDEAYGRGSRPYRTGGTLLAEASELRAIQGFDSQTYARLRPHVCALPSPELSPININGLAEADAPLIAMLTDGAVSPAAARQLIAERPPAGWSAAGFWDAVKRRSDLPPSVDPGQIAVTPRFFVLETEVAYLDAEVSASALFEDRAGRLRLAARRWTPEE